MLIGRADTSKMLAPARGTKDLSFAYHKGGKKAFLDFENLLTSWSLYTEKSSFETLPESTMKKKYIDLAETMNKIEIDYFNIKKTIKK